MYTYSLITSLSVILVEALEQASPEQKKQLADKMREEVQMAAAGQQNAAAVSNLDDDQLLEIMRCVCFIWLYYEETRGGVFFDFKSMPLDT